MYKVQISGTGLYTPKEKISNEELVQSFNKYVDEFKPGSIKESREFLERYKDVPNHAIYGQTQFVYQWISDNFIDEREIPFDTSKTLASHSPLPLNKEKTLFSLTLITLVK